MARVDPLAELVTALQRLPGIGASSAQRLAYHLLKTPREEIDALCGRAALRQGARHLLLDLQQHHRRRSLQLLHVRRSRPPPHLRRRTAGERGGGGEDARLSRPLSRADGRDRAAPGHRSGRPKIRACSARVATAASRK